MIKIISDAMRPNENAMHSESNIPAASSAEERIRAERPSQHLIEAFLASGLFFMLLPGTFLGVWNLIGISRRQALNALCPAWLRAHGQAQIFGWVGSFILGIGFYSLTKMQNTRPFPVRKGWTAWGLWTSGVALRWLGGVTGWHWRWVLPVSASNAGSIGMKRSRRVWDELLLVIEEALAVFSGVSPDLIVHSPAVPKRRYREDGRLRPSSRPWSVCTENSNYRRTHKRGEENGE